MGGREDDESLKQEVANEDGIETCSESTFQHHDMKEVAHLHEIEDAVESGVTVRWALFGIYLPERHVAVASYY